MSRRSDLDIALGVANGVAFSIIVWLLIVALWWLL